MTDYVIAKYIRLSKDDAFSDSLSISNQQLLLDAYIEDLGIPNATVLEFIDNGYSGTNVERPGFQEMIELVRCGKIQCIVTKDFSRFARNEMESGYYIEQVFPLYRVRFITVSDNYDSANYKDSTGGIDVAFKFLMHEYYSKDLSRKVKSAKHTLMKSGKHIVAGAIYGYRKNSDGKWEHDPTAAEVVREIFAMALAGKSTAQIRDKLFTDRHLAPREYEYWNKGKNFSPKYIWGTRQIMRILENEQYTGTYIAGKGEVFRVGSNVSVEKDRSEWIVIPDSHPPIVSKENFAQVQELLRSYKIKSGQGRRKAQPLDYLLRGKVKCGTCGYAMSLMNPATECIFRCMKTYADRSAACHKLKVSCAELDKTIMAIIKIQAEVVLGCSDFADFRNVGEDERQVTIIQNHINQLSARRQMCYERFIGNELDRDEFHAAKAELSASIDALASQLAIIKQAQKSRAVNKKAASFAREVANETATPRDIVNALVEKVLVFPDNQVKILWKFADFAVGV